jgi:hypothetical protein
LAVIAIVISLGALGVSWLSYEHVTATPQIDVSLPKIVRLVNQPKSAINSQFLAVIVQPTYTLLEKTDKTAIITNMSLAVRPPPGAPSPSTVAWMSVHDPAIPTDTRHFDEDPAPIVVAQDRPQAPHLLFAVYGIDPVTPGIWNFTLTARSVDGQVLTRGFCVDVAPNWASFIGRSNLASDPIPIFRNDLGDKPNPSGCYRGEF